MKHLERDFDCAASTEIGLDLETLEEGIAHAVSPGIFSDAGDEDVLAATVERQLREGKTFADPYLRFHFFGLLLRPHLRDALEGFGSAADFLETAIGVWQELPIEDRRWLR